MSWAVTIWRYIYDKLTMLALFIVAVVAWEILKYGVKHGLPRLLKKQTETGVKINWKNVLILILLAALIMALMR